MMVYKKNIIQALAQLASKEFQQVAWFPNDQGLCSSFSDDDAAVFEDTGLQEALKDGRIVFSKEADNALRILESMIRDIGYDRYDKELIDAPDMQLVRDMAAQCLTLVQASDNSKSAFKLIE